MDGREIKRRLAQTGATQSDLADFMSRRLSAPVSTKTVGRIVRGERKDLGVSESAAIEAFFAEQGYFAVPGANLEPAGKIPLYGLVAAGSIDGVAYSSDTVLDWVEAPIRNVDAAFRVTGSSMEPRLFAGETVYVKLGVSPARNQDAVVELAGENAGVLIKTYEKTAQGNVFLRQWNPESEVRLKADAVRALHAVRLRA